MPQGKPEIVLSTELPKFPQPRVQGQPQAHYSSTDNDANINRLEYWAKTWTAGTYEAHAEVLDEGWLAESNKTTSEKPAPQIVGSPFWVSGLGDTPAWTSNGQNATTIIAGQRYVISATTILTDIRYWISDASYWYKPVVVVDPLGVPTVVEGVFKQGNVGWSVQGINSVIIPAGQFVDVYVEIQDRTGGSVSNAPYDYIRPLDTSQAPNAGECNEGRLGGTANFHQTDNDTVDQSTLFTNLQVGDIITAVGNSRVVTSKTQNAPAWEIGFIDNLDFGDPGVKTFTFTSLISNVTNYVLIANHYAAEQNVQGFLQLNNYDAATVTLDENAYGIDIELQAYTFPKDWDIKARSSIQLQRDRLRINWISYEDIWQNDRSYDRYSEVYHEGFNWIAVPPVEGSIPAGSEPSVNNSLWQARTGNVGRGGMTIDAPKGDADIPALGWNILDEFDTIDITAIGMTLTVATGEFAYDWPGIWQMNIGYVMSHNESNQGRELFIRLWDVTGNAEVARTPFFIGRNQPGTNLYIPFPVVIDSATTGNAFRFEVGGGDAVSSIVRETQGLDGFQFSPVV